MGPTALVTEGIILECWFYLYGLGGVIAWIVPNGLCSSLLTVWHILAIPVGLTLGVFDSRLD